MASAKRPSPTLRAAQAALDAFEALTKARDIGTITAFELRRKLTGEPHPYVVTDAIKALMEVLENARAVQDPQDTSTGGPV